MAPEEVPVLAALEAQDMEGLEELCRASAPGLAAADVALEVQPEGRRLVATRRTGGAGEAEEMGRWRTTWTWSWKPSPPSSARLGATLSAGAWALPASRATSPAPPLTYALCSPTASSPSTRPRHPARPNSPSKEPCLPRCK